jgi:hypothetical protein
MDVKMKPKEFKFRVMSEGDRLHSFSERRMVIKKKNGDYHVYRMSGFSEGNPRVDMGFVVVITQGSGKTEIFDPETEITIRG